MERNDSKNNTLGGQNKELIKIDAIDEMDAFEARLKQRKKVKMKRKAPVQVTKYEEDEDENAEFYKHLMRNNMTGKVTKLPDIHEN